MIGTPFDLQEWDAPPPHKIGLGAPQEPPPDASLLAAQQGIEFVLLKKSFLIFFNFFFIAASICVRCGATSGCWTCPACTFVNCGGANLPTTPCGVCNRPKAGEQSWSQMRQQAAAVNMPDKRCQYNGVVYEREFDAYSEDEHPVESERWLAELLTNVVQAVYPKEPETGRIKYLFYAFFCF